MGIALTLSVVGLVAGSFANAVALDTSVDAAAVDAPSGGIFPVSLRLPLIQIVTGALFAVTPWVVGVSEGDLGPMSCRKVRVVELCSKPSA